MTDTNNPADGTEAGAETVTTDRGPPADAEPPDAAVIGVCIHRMAEIVGQSRAIERAREVDGLDVTDDGEVAALATDARRVLADLVEAYAALGGDLVPTIVAGVIVEECDVEAIDLPHVVEREIDRAI